MVTKEELNRLSWHSRRGMLELDVLLMPFTEDTYSALNSSEQEAYRKLLNCEDADLFTWFLGEEKPEDQQLCNIINKVLTQARERT